VLIIDFYENQSSESEVMRTTPVDNVE